MTGYKINVDAQDDLQNIYTYGVESFGLRLADQYYDKLYECFDIIAENPLAFPRVDYIREGYRRYIHGATSIYYRLHENDVEIMRLLGRQDPYKI